MFRFNYFYGFPPPTCYMAREAANATKHQGSSGRPVRGSGWCKAVSQCTRTILLLLTITLAATAITARAQSPPDLYSKYDIDIPQLDAATALNQLAEQTNVYLLYPYQDAKQRQANPVAGRYTLMEALAILLKDSGLAGGLSSDGVISISLVKAENRNNQNKGRPAMNGKHNILTAAIAFLLAGGASAETVIGSENSDSKRSAIIEEIVVTAQKREQNLQDTAMAISALSGETIDKRGLVGMDDYLRTLPGVSFQDRGAGQNILVIRGMMSEPQGDDQTSGVYFGETPITGLGSPNNDGGGGSLDIKLVDIQRIEVLRGPQGTLYGASSLGGTVRAIPVSPNLSEVGGKVSMRYSQTGEEGGNNNMAQGVINIPLIEDKLAIRGVAYRFDNDGYIKNVAASQPIQTVLYGTAAGGIAQDRNNIGGDEYTGVRLSTLWRPIDELDVSLTYVRQKIEQDGFPEVNTSLAGDYQQARLNTGSQGSSYESLGNEVDITNLVVDYDFGWGVLTNSTSWTDYEANVEWDSTAIRRSPYYAVNTYEQDVFVEELRLASQFSGPLQFLVGLYYEDNDRDFLGIVPWSGEPSLDMGPFIVNDVVSTNRQKALFGELSYQLTDQVKVTTGVRRFDYERAKTQTASIFGTVVVDGLFLETKETGDTWKFSLDWTPTEDMLIYGQWAEGFRLGRPLRIPLPTCDANQDGLLDDLGVAAPSGTDSDNTQNFEIGIKASMLENRVTVNAALYHIDWKGIPVRVDLPVCGDSTWLNAGRSKSEGVELEVQTFLSENILWDISTSYGEATLTEDADNIGSKGDNLPGSADFNFSTGLEYRFLITGRNSFARLDYVYVGEYYHNVSETGKASGDYSLVNLKLGIEWDSVDADLFVNNLTNANDFTWVETNWNLNRAYRLRPRTIGLNFSYHF